MNPIKNSRMFGSFLPRAYGPSAVLLPLILLSLWDAPPELSSVRDLGRLGLLAAWPAVLVVTDVLVTGRTEGKELIRLGFVVPLLGWACVGLGRYWSWAWAWVNTPWQSAQSPPGDWLDELFAGLGALVAFPFVVLFVVAVFLFPLWAVTMLGGIVVAAVKALCEEFARSLLGGTVFFSLCHLFFLTTLLVARGAQPTFQQHVWPALKEDILKDMETGEHRKAARELLLLCYADYAPVIGGAYPQSLLTDYVRDYMGDDRGIEEVKRAGLQLRQKLGDLYAREKAKALAAESRTAALRQQLQEKKARVEAARLAIERLKARSDIDPSELEESIEEEERKIRQLEKDIAELESP